MTIMYLIHIMAELEMFECKRIIPLNLKIFLQLFRHPLDLRFGKLDDIVAHVVQEGEGVRDETRVFNLPKVVHHVGQFKNATRGVHGNQDVAIIAEGLQ